MPTSYGFFCSGVASFHREPTYLGKEDENHVTSVSSDCMKTSSGDELVKYLFEEVLDFFACVFGGDGGVRREQRAEVECRGISSAKKK